MELSYEAIGKRIRKARLRREMTQDKLAALCDLSTQHISNIEHAHTKLSLPALVSIANALHVSVDELLCDSIYKSKSVLQDDFARIFQEASDTETKFLLESARAVHAVYGRIFPNDKN